MRREGIGVAGCSVDCYQDMYSSGSNSGSNSNDNVFSYEKKQFSLSELIASYWLNNIIPKKKISKLDRSLRGYYCSPA